MYANWLYETEDVPSEPEIPAVVLVVSGAHSDLVLMEAHRRFRPLGRTIDEKVFDRFEKVTRWIAGPAVRLSALAKLRAQFRRSES